jgi:hypothetical protein
MIEGFINLRDFQRLKLLFLLWDKSEKLTNRPTQKRRVYETLNHENFIMTRYKILSYYALSCLICHD